MQRTLIMNTCPGQNILHRFQMSTVRALMFTQHFTRPHWKAQTKGFQSVNRNEVLITWLCQFKTCPTLEAISSLVMPGWTLPSAPQRHCLLPPLALRDDWFAGLHNSSVHTVDQMRQMDATRSAEGVKMAWFLSQQWRIPVNGSQESAPRGTKSLQRHEMNTSPLQQHLIQETLLFSLSIQVMYQGLLQKSDRETVPSE